MNKIGYSTGAIALGDFSKAIVLLADHPFEAIELSALRINEVEPLIDALTTLNLGKYSYISFHAPSAFSVDEEGPLVKLLSKLPREWPIVLHPDAVHRFELWSVLADRLAIENMDGRKSTGRSVRELEEVFVRLPSARMCLDLGHARQVDSSMVGAYLFLEKFSERIVQLHVSEVDTMSRHEVISFGAGLAFSQLRRFIPKSVAVIIESRVKEQDIDQEVYKVRDVLSLVLADDPSLTLP
jgi:hypothetical protein